jgi:hypothetical protein
MLSFWLAKALDDFQSIRIILFQVASKERVHKMVAKLKNFLKYILLV